jgi:regulator of protease activity HflC (stomatin/prohibitin superfamily)
MRNVTVVVVLCFVASILGGCTRIGPGHVGIEVNQAGSQRGVQDFTVTTGYVFYDPIATSVIEYPTFVQTAVWTHDPGEGHPANEEITFTTKDSMVVSIDVNLSYTLLAEKVPAFYVKFRSDDIETFTNGYLRNVARDCFNETAGSYVVEQIMGDNAPFLKASKECLQNDMNPIGVHIEQFGIIGAPRPPDNVREAINLKVQAAQIALQKQNEVASAEADARKIIAAADGQAQANRKLTESITPMAASCGAGSLDQPLEWLHANGRSR